MARCLNGPVGRGRVVVFFLEPPDYFLRILVRNKIRVLILQWFLGHENTNQNPRLARLVLLSPSIAIACPDFAYNKNT